MRLRKARRGWRSSTSWSSPLGSSTFSEASSQAYEYLRLLKPRVLIAMEALYVASFLISASEASLDVLRLALGIAIVFAAVGGANALNCYLDRDIDGLMVRTRRRPLPSGTVEASRTLVFSLLLLFIASAASIDLGLVPFLIFVEGLGSYVILYTVLLKRRTSLNVLATAPAVAAPAWFGWFMGGSPLGIEGVSVGLVVAIWGPLHLWSLAYAFSDDYARGGVPMLTSVVEGRTSVVCVLVSLLGLVASSYLLVPWGRSSFYPLAISLLNASILLAGFRFLREQSRRSGWVLFKLTSPYIVLLLFLFAADRYLFRA